MSEDYPTIYDKRGASYEKGWKFQWLRPVPAALPTSAKTARWPQPRAHTRQFYSDFQKTSFVLCSGCSWVEKHMSWKTRIYTSQMKYIQTFIRFVVSVIGMQGKRSKSADVWYQPVYGCEETFENSMESSVLLSDLNKKISKVSWSSGI
jgi:hypothetical protein